jgi:hypothetical protein
MILHIGYQLKYGLEKTVFPAWQKNWQYMDRMFCWSMGAGVSEKADYMRKSAVFWTGFIYMT